MSTKSYILYALGIEEPQPRPKKKRKSTTFRRRPRSVIPYAKKYAIPYDEGLDTDLMKLENLHGGFCSCGRRMQGEAQCAHCSNDLDW